MSNRSDNEKWQDLRWFEKMQICQQGFSHEDNLLFTYTVLFIAIEAMFFVLVFNLDSPCWLLMTISIFAILVAILFIYHFYRRGQAVDRWGERIYKLWRAQDADEFIAHYKGCVERRLMDRKKCGWFCVIFGWGLNPWRWIKSGRRVIVSYTPVLVILAWLIVIFFHL